MRFKILLVVFALLLTIGSTIIWVGQSTAVMGRAQTVLADEVNKHINGNISFSRLEIDSFHSAALYDVVIRDTKGEIIAVAAQAKASFNLWSVFFGNMSLSALQEVELLEPRLFLVQRNDGGWNLESLLKEQGGQEDIPFSAVVQFSEGMLQVSTAGQEFLVDHVRGKADFLHKPRIEFALNGVFNGEKITVEGAAKNKDSFFARVNTNCLELSRIAPLMPAGGLAIQSGELKDVTFVIRQNQGSIAYAGEADISQLGVDLNGFSIRETNGLAVFTQQKLHLYHMTGSVQGQPVQVQGTIALNTIEPVLDVSVQSTGVELNAIDPAIPLAGKAAISAQISGLVSSPVVQGEMTMAETAIADIALTNWKAKLALAEHLLTISECSAQVQGGSVTATGQLHLDSRRYQVHVNGNGINLAGLPGVPPKAGGLASFDITANGQGTDRPALSGTVALTDARCAGLMAEELKAGFYWAGNQTVLDYVTITAGQGTLAASGVLQSGQLNLSLLGQSVPLERLSALAGISLTGSADVRGSIGGTLDRPTLSTAVQAHNGQVLGQPFAQAEGRLEITPEQVMLQEFVAKNGPTVHQVNGTIGLAGDKMLNLAVNTKAARAETLIGLIMPGEQLTGNVDNELIIAGPLADWTMTGKVKLWNGSFRGQLVSLIQGQYRRQHGIITLDNFVVQALNTEIRMAGTVSASQELDIDFAAKDVDLAKFNSTDYPMSGQASFTGHLAGPASAPAFDGQLTADKIRLNGQEVTSINGTIRSVGSRIHVEQFSFSQSGGLFTFTGGLEQQDQTIYGTTTVANGQLSSLLAILNSPVKEIEGKLNGNIEIGGTLTKPDITVVGNLQAGKIKNYPLDNIDIDVNLHNDVLLVNTFFAKQGDGVLAIRGTADLNGDIQLEVGGRDIDAGLLTAWFAASWETGGKLTFSAEVNGKTADPQVALSLQIANGKVANASFDELYGLFAINKGSIHVNQVMLVKGPYKASAYGLIPVAALSREGRAKGTALDQMNLTVTLDKANLSILPLLSKEVDWATGETKGQIRIGGTLYQPIVTGQFAVPDGVIKLKSLAQPIQKVAVDIQFEGDTISIKSFSGQMGGGNYSLTGGAKWQGMGLSNYNLALSLNRLGVDHRYFKGPLQGNLQLTVKNNRPLLSGTMEFENTTINIPFLPEFGESDVNLGLDLEIVAGKKVRLYNSYLYDVIVEGRAKFSGSVRHPAATGRFSAVRGTVSYLRTAFKLHDAVADFTQYGSFVPVLHLNASTRLEQTTVNLSINGPLQAMEMKLTAEPAMSQQEILSLLTLRSRYFEKSKAGGTGHDSGLGRDEVIGLLDAGLQMRFISEMEGAFRKAFGLDEFRIVRGTLSAEQPNGLGKSTYTPDDTISREVYNIEIGKYVTDRLLLSYTMGVDHQEYNIAFRYDLNRRVSLTGSRDNYSRSRFGLETRFTF